MTTRYFEHAVSEGEGTLTRHAVVHITKDNDWFGLYLTADRTQVIAESITAERYAEFITIHGSEVAV